MDTATVELIVKLLAESGTAERVAWIWFYAQMIDAALGTLIITALVFLGWRGIKAIENS